MAIPYSTRKHGPATHSLLRSPHSANMLYRRDHDRGQGVRLQRGLVRQHRLGERQGLRCLHTLHGYATSNRSSVRQHHCALWCLCSRFLRFAYANSSPQTNLVQVGPAYVSRFECLLESSPHKKRSISGFIVKIPLTPSVRPLPFTFHT